MSDYFLLARRLYLGACLTKRGPLLQFLEIKCSKTGVYFSRISGKHGPFLIREGCCNRIDMYNTVYIFQKSIIGRLYGYYEDYKVD